MKHAESKVHVVAFVMNARASLSTLAFSTALATVCASPAFAQAFPAAPAQATSQVPAPSPTADDQASTGDIIVTAQKRSERLSRVGTTVSALSGDQLKKQGITSVADLAQVTPGLAFAQSETNTPVYTLRGVGFNDPSLAAYPDVAVYVDQVPLSFPALSAEAGLDLERVEVLKGPQGILFGQNSTGGAINYIAAKPTSTLQAGNTITYGRFNLATDEGYVSGPLTDTLSARLAVRGEAGGAWQESISRDDTLGNHRLIEGRLLLDWNPVSIAHFELSLGGWLNKSDPQAPQYELLTPEHPAAVQAALLATPFSDQNARSADWSPTKRPRGNDRQLQVALHGDINLSPDVTLTSITSYIDYRRDDLINDDGTALDVTNNLAQGTIKSFTQELRLANSNINRLRWQLGGNFESSHVNDYNLLTFSGSSTFNLFGFYQNFYQSIQDMRNFAAFGNTAFDLTSKLTLKGGLRFTDSLRKDNFCVGDAGDGLVAAFFTATSSALRGSPTPAIQPGQCVSLNEVFLPSRVLSSLHQNNVSWQLGFDYKLSPSTLFYVNVTKGYKAGSYPNLTASSTRQVQPVTQESVLDYEGGVKFQSRDHTLFVTAAVFYYDYTDKQVLGKYSDPIFGVQSALVNIPKSDVLGAEASASWKPVKRLTISPSITYLKTKIKDYTGIDQDGQTASFDGDPLPFAPKWSYSVAADYDFPINAGLDGFIGGNVGGKSATETVTGASAAQTTNAYALVDLRGGVNLPDRNWRLSIWGKNVLNKYYWTNVVRTFEQTIRYSAMPATYGVSFTTKF